MKGIDWGRIVARLLAVWILTVVVGMIVSAVEFHEYSYAREFSWLNWAHIGALLALAILLWFHGIKLAPAVSQSTVESEPNGRFVARVIITCAGALIFLNYGVRAGVQLLKYIPRDPSEPIFMIDTSSVVANVIATLIGAALIAAPSLIIGRLKT